MRSAAASSAFVTVPTMSGREALRRLVDEEQPVLVHERARERDHLLLAAREGAGLLLGALDELGEELGDDRAVGGAAALGEPQVLLDRELAEDLAVLRHVGDALLHDAVGQQLVDARARRRSPRRCARRGRAAP